MSGHRLSLRTIKSLTALPKVRSSSSSIDSGKIFYSSRNLSIATERSDFESSNEYYTDSSPDHYFNHGSLHGGRSLNHTTDIGESPRDEFSKNQVGQNVNFRERSVALQKDSNGRYHSSGGAYGDRLRREYQNGSTRIDGGYLSESSGNEFRQGTLYGPNNGHVQYTSCEINGGVSRGFDQNSNGLHSQTSAHNSFGVNPHGPRFQKSPGYNYSGNVGVDQKSLEGYQQNPNGVVVKSRDFKQNSNGPYWQSSCQNSDCTSSQGLPQLHGHIHGVSSQNHRHFQKGMGYNHVGGYQQNPAGGQRQSIPNVGLLQHNTNVAQHRSTYDDNQNRAAVTQVASKPGCGASSAEISSGQYRGTIMEFNEFCKERKIKEAVEVLRLLEKQNILVEFSQYEMLIWECGEAKALQEAKIVHEHVMRSVSPLGVGTYNMILEMYSKCGSMDDAFSVFDKMPTHNMTSWDTMIRWLAKNGLGENAIDLFSEFKRSGQTPDGQIFVGVFSACDILGDVNEGLLHFESMTRDYGIVPTMEHYRSIVELMGSAGHLEEALEFIEKMPLEPSVDVWETLMNLCRVHGYAELGDRCTEVVEQLQPSRLDEQSKGGLLPVKPSGLAKVKGMEKLEGRNPLEVKSRVIEYRAGDTSHPDSDKIYAQLRALKAQMKEAGYIPETRFVLHDIDQESREEALLAHSERLAVSYALISSPPRASVRIIKNLRVCVDCHNALKIMSKIVGRDIIMRDAKRFHHIKDGVCSCGDFW